MTFQEAQERWRQLRADLSRGALDRAACTAAVSEIRVQGGDGRPWQIDPFTGKWLLWNGKAWVRSVPPLTPNRSAITATVQPVADCPVPVSAPAPNASVFGRLTALVSMMFNPGAIVQHRLSGIAWPLAILVPGAAFTIFFFQTGLDMMRAGKAGALKVTLLTLAGGLYGTFGIAGIALVAWVLSRLFGSTRALGWVIGAYALAYSPTLVYGLCGMAASLVLGWKTALAFGVTGVLWALRPMMAVNDELTGGRKGFSIFLSTVCGAVVLFGWGLLCRI